MKPTHGRNLICGDFPDLEAAFAKRVRELRSADALAPLVVLVPTSLLRRHLGQSLVVRGVPFVNVQIVTFAALVRGLVEPALWAEGQSPLPPLADILIMAAVCQKLGAESYFSRIADRPGLHRSLLNAIQDLKEATADVAAFDAARKRLGDLHATVQTKLAGLAAIWKSYESLKAKHRFVDDADQHALACELIAQNPQLVAADELIVYGMYDFKRMQARLVHEIAQHVPTTIFFPFESTPVWVYARPSLEMLEAAGFTRADAARSESCRSEELQRLCDRLFATYSHPSPPTPLPSQTRGEGRSIVRSLEIVSAPGENREAQELPRVVLDLARTDRVPFAEVGVLLRVPAATRRVRDAFDEAALPVQVPAGVPLAETRAGRSFMLMLQILAEDFSRRDVMEFLTYADLDFDSLVGTAEPPLALWDALSMRANIVRGRDKWLPRLASLRRFLARQANELARREAREREREADDPARDPAMVDGLVRTVTKLFESLDAIARSRTWSEWVGNAVGAFQSLVRPSDSRGEVITAVAPLARLDAIQPTADHHLLARLIAEVLASERVDERREAADGPIVTALMQARGVPFRAVIVPGMVERSFPQPASPDPILLDHERERLNEAFAAATRSERGTLAEPVAHGGSPNGSTRTTVLPGSALAPRLPVKANQALEERLLFRLAIGAARERVMLTFPRIEAETGRQRVPSYFLLRTLDALGDSRDARGTLAGVTVTETPSTTPVAVSGSVVDAADTDRATANVRRPARSRRAPSPSQLVLPFAQPSSRASDVTARQGGEPPGAAASRQATLPESATHAPATYETLKRWPGLRHVRLSELAPDGARALSLFEFDLGAAIASVRAGTPVVAAFAAIAPHFARGVVAESVRWSRRQFTRFDGFVEDTELRDTLRRQSPLERSISPSRIEDYARCPFHFFMHNLLHLEELIEPEELTRADPIAKGRLVHRILEEFLRTMKEQNRLPLTIDCERDLLEIAAREIDDFEQSGAAGPVLTWRVEREQLEQFFRDFIEWEIEWQKEGFLPARFEMKFGRDDAPPDVSKEPAEIDIGGGRVLRFHGIIDRVDIRNDDRAIFVIDYKGRKLPEPGRDGTEYGRAVQLPIYALGACAALRGEGEFHPHGGRYISGQPGVPRKEIAAPSEESNARLRVVLRTIADGIHAGLFMQYTGREACNYCPYDRVCMGVQDEIARRKSHDETAAAYLDMKTEELPLERRKRK